MDARYLHCRIGYRLRASVAVSFASNSCPESSHFCRRSRYACHRRSFNSCWRTCPWFYLFHPEGVACRLPHWTQCSLQWVPYRKGQPKGRQNQGRQTKCSQWLCKRSTSRKRRVSKMFSPLYIQMTSDRHRALLCIRQLSQWWPVLRVHTIVRIWEWSVWSFCLSVGHTFAIWRAVLRTCDSNVAYPSSPLVMRLWLLILPKCAKGHTLRWSLYHQASPSQCSTWSLSPWQLAASLSWRSLQERRWRWIWWRTSLSLRLCAPTSNLAHACERFFERSQSKRLQSKRPVANLAQSDRSSETRLRILICLWRASRRQLS